MRKRAFLVGTHQTAVARDIRGQNSCQPLYVLAAQDARPSSWKLNCIYQNYGPMSPLCPSPKRVNSAVLPPASLFRSSPMNGHRQSRSVCRKRANTGGRSSHSITLSARLRMLGEIARPIAFAVSRLIAISTLVGSSTGSSSGLAPLSVLSTAKNGQVVCCICLSSTHHPQLWSN